MRFDRRFVGWGIFLIALASLPLAVRQGWMSAAQVADLWRFWPLILVGLGLGLLAGTARLALVGTLVTSLTVGLALGGGLAASGAANVGIACTGGAAGSGSPAQHSGSFGSRATVELEGACGELSVSAAPGASWSTSATAPDGRLPVVEATAERLHVQGSGGLNLNPTGRRLQVTLPGDPTLDLSVANVAGSSTVTLGGTRLGSLHGSFQFGSATIDLTGAALSGPLDLAFDFGSARLTLPADQTFDGRVRANFGSLRVCAPAGTGLRLVTSENFGSSNLAAAGLVGRGNTWTTPGYESAATRISLELSANFSSLNLSRGGC